MPTVTRRIIYENIRRYIVNDIAVIREKTISVGLWQKRPIGGFTWGVATPELEEEARALNKLEGELSDRRRAFQKRLEASRDLTSGPSEFDKWMERFEKVPARHGIPAQPAKCMYPEREGPHKKACLAPATRRSPDRCPVCQDHAGIDIRPLWRGSVEGA